MTEAFEIGVSLALQDGVSDAIGKARRDVAALEHAVRESGVSLRSLREVGARSASVAIGDQRRGGAEKPSKNAVRDEGPRLVTDAAPRAEVSASPHLEMIVVPSAEKEAAPRVETVAAPRVQAEFVPNVLSDAVVPPAGGSQWGAGALPRADGAHKVTAPTPVVGPPQRDAAAAVTDMRAEARRPLDEAVARRGIAAAPDGAPEKDGQVSAPPADLARAEPARAVGQPSAVSTESAAPVAPRTAREAEPGIRLSAVQLPAQSTAPARGDNAAERATPPGNMPAPLDRDAGQGFAGRITLQSALRLSGGAPAMMRDQDQVEAVDDAAAPGGAVEAEDARLAQAPAATTANAAPRGGVGAPTARAQSMAHQAEPRDAGPQEGDVFLDGMLVGRWMSRFLTREAERASAGPTGFDARRGRLLPGVTVGG